VFGHVKPLFGLFLVFHIFIFLLPTSQNEIFGSPVKASFFVRRSRLTDVDLRYDPRAKRKSLSVAPPGLIPDEDAAFT
jgi:hypothetical protein